MGHVECRHAIVIEQCSRLYHPRIGGAGACPSTSRTSEKCSFAQLRRYRSRAHWLLRFGRGQAATVPETDQLPGATTRPANPSRQHRRTSPLRLRRRNADHGLRTTKRSPERALTDETGNKDRLPAHHHDRRVYPPLRDRRSQRLLIQIAVNTFVGAPAQA